MSGGLRVRLACLLTALATLLGFGLAVSPVAADEMLPERTLNAEPGQITYFAPASTTATNWTIESPIPEWLGGVGTGEWDEQTRYAHRFAVLVQPSAPYGETVRLAIAEYSDGRGVLRYDLLLTVGAGIETAEPISVVAVPGATTRVEAAGARTGSWYTEGGPAWLADQQISGVENEEGYFLLYLDIPADVTVGQRGVTTVIEQQVDADGRDVGQVRRDVTVTVMPPLEESWEAERTITAFDRPVVLDGRRSQYAATSRGLAIKSAAATFDGQSAFGGVVADQLGSITYEPALRDAGRKVRLEWQLGYADVLGADVPRMAEVEVEFLPGPKPKIISSARDMFVEAGAAFTGEVKLNSVAADGQRLWSQRIQALRGTRDPENDVRAPSFEVDPASETGHVRVPASAQPGSYRLMARLTDAHGISGSTRVGVLHVVKELQPRVKQDRVRVRASRWTTVDPLRNDRPGATPKGTSARSVSGVQLRIVDVAGHGTAQVVSTRQRKTVRPQVRILASRPGSTVRVRYVLTNAAGEQGRGTILARVGR